MGKNKLSKFADMETFPNVFQYTFETLKTKKFPLKGKWHNEYFKNDHPITLELGCGKGEYTVELARMFPERNFIGIDLKGARMWSGAQQSLQEKLSNVAFVRTGIEFIRHFFDENEVAEIWITFPDPQMKKANKRLTSTRFMEMYSHILHKKGAIHLKTDSPFLYTYTLAMIEENRLPILSNTADVYQTHTEDKCLQIQTFYEQQWRSRGLKIKYIQWQGEKNKQWIEPEIDIEKDDYRSFKRK